MLVKNKRTNLDSFTFQSCSFENCSSTNINNSPKTSTAVDFTNDTSKTSNFPDNSPINEEQ